MKKGTILHTLIIAVLVCLLCSLFVSLSAVLLKPQQVANARYNEQVNIVLTAGLITPAQINNKQLVTKIFNNIESKIVNIYR